MLSHPFKLCRCRDPCLDASLWAFGHCPLVSSYLCLYWWLIHLHAQLSSYMDNDKKKSYILTSYYEPHALYYLSSYKAGHCYLISYMRKQLIVVRKSAQGHRVGPQPICLCKVTQKRKDPGSVISKAFDDSTMEARESVKAECKNPWWLLVMLFHLSAQTPQTALPPASSIPHTQQANHFLRSSYVYPSPMQAVKRKHIS